MQIFILFPFYAEDPPDAIINYIGDRRAKLDSSRGIDTSFGWDLQFILHC